MSTGLQCVNLHLGIWLSSLYTCVLYAVGQTICYIRTVHHNIEFFNHNLRDGIETESTGKQRWVYYFSGLQSVIQRLNSIFTVLNLYNKYICMRWWEGFDSFSFVQVYMLYLHSQFLLYVSIHLSSIKHFTLFLSTSIKHFTSVAVSVCSKITAFEIDQISIWACFLLLNSLNYCWVLLRVKRGF